jgi:hypothetical protein
MKMDRLTCCVCLTLILLLFLKSETRPLSPNMEEMNQFRSLPALVKGTKELLNSDLQNEDTITDRYNIAREVPGGPNPKHHYKYQK